MAPEPAAEMSGRLVTTLLTAMDGINSDASAAGQLLVYLSTDTPGSFLFYYGRAIHHAVLVSF